MSGLVTVGRLVFGGWLIVLGLNCFYPLIPITISDGDLSKILITAFRDTGLLGAVALAFLPLGALIVADRLTVLALGAALPVFVCGLYWACFLEHSSGLALLVIISLTINIRLLAAYWPYISQLFEMKARSASETGAEQSPLWRWAEVLSRYVWGIWFVWSGTFHFYSPPIYGDQPLAVELMVALIQTRLYEIVKGVEIIGGVTVLARRWAPLGLLINVPINLVVMYWDGYLQGQLGALGLIIVLLTFVFTAIMMWSYRAYYRPLLSWRPRHQWVAPLPSGRKAA